MVLIKRRMEIGVLYLDFGKMILWLYLGVIFVGIEIVVVYGLFII